MGTGSRSRGLQRRLAMAHQGIREARKRRDRGGREGRPCPERYLRFRRKMGAVRAIPQRRRETALPLAGPGAESRVALHALHVAVAVRDGRFQIRDGDVLAGADDRLVGDHLVSSSDRAAATPAAEPERGAAAPGAPATLPAANSQDTLVRPPASTATGKPFSSAAKRVCAPAAEASSCSGAGGNATATASQAIRSESARSSRTGLPRARSSRARKRGRSPAGAGATGPEARGHAPAASTTRASIYPALRSARAACKTSAPSPTTQMREPTRTPVVRNRSSSPRAA